MRILTFVLIFIPQFNILAQSNDSENEPLEYIYDDTKEIPLKAYVFQPDEKIFKGKHPAVVIFHGGGWSIGEAAGTGRDCCTIQAIRPEKYHSHRCNGRCL